MKKYMVYEYERFWNDDICIDAIVDIVGYYSTEERAREVVNELEGNDANRYSPKYKRYYNIKEIYFE